MGCFPYTCESCGGGEKRCGKEHDYDDFDCERCCNDAKCECEKCTICAESEHIYPVCPGGQCCWEPEVVCVPVNYKDFKCPENLVGVAIHGVWDSYGGIEDTEEKYDKYEFYICDVIDYYDLTTSKYIPVKIWCKSCYDKLYF